MMLYLSGPMTSYPDWNYPAFAAVAHALRERGHQVFNPAETFGGDPSRPRAEYMRLDVAALLTVEAVVILPGWEQSKGATLEVAIARELELPVYDVGTFLTTAAPEAIRWDE
jgi:hypothetical protein